jgi:hypothetical protein
MDQRLNLCLHKHWILHSTISIQRDTGGNGDHPFSNKCEWFSQCNIQCLKSVCMCVYVYIAYLRRQLAGGGENVWSF